MKSKAIIIFISLFLMGTSTNPFANNPVRTKSIQGRVTDFLGAPIAGAKIEVSTEDNTGRWLTQSDAKGNYKIINVSTAWLKISVSYRGFHQEELKVYPKSGRNIIDVGLQAGDTHVTNSAEIRGTVRQADNSPMADATVTVTSAFNPRMVERVRTSHEGQYKFKIGCAGQFIVHASKPGFLVNAKTVVLLPTYPCESRTEDLVLRPLGLP